MLSDELQIVLNGHGITFHPPQEGEDARARIEVVYASVLDESFEVSPVENDVEAIVDAIFTHITTRDYALGESVHVAAYEIKRIHARATAD